MSNVYSNFVIGKTLESLSFQELSKAHSTFESRTDFSRALAIVASAVAIVALFIFPKIALLVGTPIILILIVSTVVNSNSAQLVEQQIKKVTAPIIAEIEKNINTSSNKYLVFHNNAATVKNEIDQIQNSLRNLEILHEDKQRLSDSCNQKKANIDRAERFKSSAAEGVKAFGAGVAAEIASQFKENLFGRSS